MSHIGTTPYKYRIDVFISYIDNIKNAPEVCVTWERRGKTQATNTVKVKEDKAIVRETLSMESTLFRRNVKEKSRKAPSDPDQLKFDDKKVKFVLRKGGPEGKSIGKISMNIAEYVRGVTSTVFADLKLSNSSVIVSKIEATMLHAGKKSKTGSPAGSEAYSEMSESNSLDADSLFGEDDEITGDLEIPVTKATPKKSEEDSDLASRKVMDMSPMSEASFLSPNCSPTPNEPSSLSSTQEAFETEAEEQTPNNLSKKSSSLSSPPSPKGPGSELQQSPSLRQKLKKKIKEKTGRKEKDDDAESSTATTAMRKSKAVRNTANDAEVRELRFLVESLKEENAKLRRSKQAAMDEIDALRNDLEACENALEEVTEGKGGKDVGSCNEAGASIGAKDRKIAELSAQNESLLEELEERHEEEAQSNVDGKSFREKMKTLHNRIEDLEVALRREPQFLDVVNELKVTKVSLALANMEKEQAIFALHSLKQELGVEDP